ncbi:MAG: hypothetical protein AB9846_03325 [Tenuifilaceae bacterium]
MRLIITIILITYGSCSLGQNSNPIIPYSNSISKEQLSHTINMLKSLNEKGLDRNKDSVFVSEEFTKLLRDSTYRKEIYQKEYTWEQTIKLIQKTELKKAFWYLINLYPTSDKNKELVIKSIITYETLFKMDEVLINTFYTYAFTDPVSSIIVDNKPEITRPDILEGKLRTVYELVQYIYKYRDQNDNSK